MCSRCNPDRSTSVEARVIRFVTPGLDETVAVLSMNRVLVSERECNVPYRPDLALQLRDGSYIIVEIDEDQHDGYPEVCEIKRMMDIAQGLQGHAVFFIRVGVSRKASTRYLQLVADQVLAKVGEIADGAPYLEFRVDASYINYSASKEESMRARLESAVALIRQ